MNIANPIYDVVFKYLMEDSKIAKMLIGLIMGEEILELNFAPQEHTIALRDSPLTVYRVDFTAKIKTEQGFKNVLIEIQKAKFSSDIMRFRRYLGDHYSNKENTYTEQVGSIQIKKPLPIVSIYFLGYPLKGINAPVIKVHRHYYDVIDDHQKITQKAEFIESLTHDSFIIQIPCLREKYRNDLECLLSIFDQHKKISDGHILNVNEADFPEKYRSVIRRLQVAISETEVQETMNIEDEILEELQNKERQHAQEMEKAVEKAVEKAIEEKDKVIEQKNKDLEAKDKDLEAKNKDLAAKEAVIKKLMEEIKQSKK
jgi:hypothetical protein